MMHRAPVLRDALRSLVILGAAGLVVGLANVGVAQAPPPPPPPPPPAATAPSAAPPAPTTPPAATQTPPAQPPQAPPPVAAQPGPALGQPAPLTQPAPQAFEEEEEQEPRSRRSRRRTREARPAKLEWKPGEAIPTGYEPRSGPAKRLLISGLVTCGTVYVGSSIAAYIGVFAGTTELAPLFAPVIGPFITVETAGAEGAAAYLLALNGLTQAAGLTLSIMSGFVEDTWLAKLPTGMPLDDDASAPRIRANAGLAGGSFAIDF